MKVIILAGGIGKRLWPLSQPHMPKQFLDLYGEGSLLQKTIERFSSKEIFILTGEKFAQTAREQISLKYPIKDILIEPLGLNTAPAVAYAVRYFLKHERSKGSDLILISPSDHYIRHQKAFDQALEKAQYEASKGSVALFGIPPSYPETEFGYMEANQDSEHAFSIERFIEKPPLDQAKQYCCSKNMFWNSGMFLFSLDTILSEFKLHAPGLYNWIMDPGISFNSLQSVSLDHALIEKSSRLRMVLLEAGWSDVGSWDRLYNILPKDSEHNVIRGNIEAVNTKHSLIFAHEKKITVHGLKNLIIVDTPESLYITSRIKEELI